MQICGNLWVSIELHACGRQVLGPWLNRRVCNMPQTSLFCEALGWLAACAPGQLLLSYSCTAPHNIVRERTKGTYRPLAN